MAITINIRYTGEGDAAQKFAREMILSGTVDEIRAEAGNLRYEYFVPIDESNTVLLIDSWVDQAALDAHHASSMMAKIAELREKYDLHMSVERYVSIDENDADGKFIRR